MGQTKERTIKNNKNTKTMKKDTVFKLALIALAVLVILLLLLGKHFSPKSYAKETETVTETKEVVEVPDRDDLDAMLERLETMEKTIEESKKEYENSGNKDALKRIKKLEKNITETKTGIQKEITRIDSGEKIDVTDIYKKMSENYKSISEEYEKMIQKEINKCSNAMNEKIDNCSNTINLKMQENQTISDQKISTLEAEITTLKDSLQTVSAKVNSVDTYYPVGSIYLSLDGKNPAEIWGGSWELIAQGQTLIGASDAYPMGSTGGSSSVTLTRDNIPNYDLIVNDPGHGHGLTDPGHEHTGTITGGNHRHAATVGGPSTHNENAHSAFNGNTYGNGTLYTGWSGDLTFDATIQSATTGISIDNGTTGISVSSGGGGQGFSVMQPYLVVNIWKRVA